MKQIRMSLLGFIAVAALVMPTVSVLAADVSVANGTGDPKQANFQIVPCSGIASASSSSPACDFQQLIVMFQRIVSFLLYISIPLVLGMVMYTAFKYLTANGDPGKLANAKKMFVPVVIGIFWVLAAWVVVNTFLANLLTDSQSQANNVFLNTLK